MRTFEANPMEIIMEFPQPTELQKVTAMVGSPATRLSVTITLSEDGEEVTFSATGTSSAQIRPISVDFGSTYRVNRLTITVESINEPEPTHVHLWELILE